MQPRPISVSFPFDADLTDFILTTLSDIRSLESLVLSSKFVYNVFNTRRASILRAVVSNLLRSVSPLAMWLLKVMTDVDAYWRGWLAPFPVSRIPAEQASDPGNQLTMREARMLAVNHDVVRNLESVYSWRKKDPRSSSSRLTQHESERFQMAMYRVWFVCALYGRPAPANRAGKSRPKRLSGIQRDLGREQAKFLQTFTPAQVVPLMEAWKFMGELATWAVRADVIPHKVKKENVSLQAYLLWCGPSTTLQAFQGKLTSVDRKVVLALRSSYEQFRDVFNIARSLEQPGEGILESPDGSIWNKLKCQQCTQPHPECLWNECNWSYLRGIAPPLEFFHFVKIPWWNSYPDENTLAEICRSIPCAELVGEAFLLRSDSYRAWEPEHWLCTTCLQTFLRDNIEAVCRSHDRPKQ